MEVILVNPLLQYHLAAVILDAGGILSDVRAMKSSEKVKELTDDTVVSHSLFIYQLQNYPTWPGVV